MNAANIGKVQLNLDDGFEAILTGTCQIRAGTAEWGTAGEWDYPTWGTQTEAACLLEPLSEVEQVTLMGPMEGETKRLYLKPAETVDANSTVEVVGGGTYEVYGAPQTFEDPYTGTAHHIEAILTRKL